MALHPKFWSRKLAGASLSAAAVFVAWVLTQWLHVAGQYFGVLCTTIVALYTSYAAGNVVHKAMTKADPASDPANKPQQ